MKPWGAEPIEHDIRYCRGLKEERDFFFAENLSLGGSVYWGYEDGGRAFVALGSSEQLL